ncbi:MAG: ATP-binding protein [Lachnospiraceae bacterium]|nr:ATP-binding protein [Lachnospiraceae bacterium]
MKRLQTEYWEAFIDKDKDGNVKGNGEAFENLVEQLLIVKYGKKWERTKKSHDDNRDFWIHLEDQHIWAECKNYKDSIAMSVLAPTLVMAQIYEVNEILFFCRSSINPFAKNKIMAFGEKSNKTILFYDGENLENLIWKYRAQLPKKYSPLNYLKTIEADFSISDFVHVYFFRNAVSHVQEVSETFESYVNADTIYYNETFALTFCLENFLQTDGIEVCIEFMDEGTERFAFQYFYPTVVPEKKQWYQAYLKDGEGRAVSLNLRQIKYTPKIHFPQFHISFFNPENGQSFDWYSEIVSVKCNWIGKTRLIGANYLRILEKTKEQLLHNPCLTSLVLTGSSGTGKSRILTECQNIFLKNGYHIINFSGQKGFSSHYFLKEIISFLYEIPSNDILKLLEERLLFDSSKERNSIYTESEKALYLLRMIIQSNSEDSLQELLNIYGNIIYEKLSKHKNVLIIDNMQYIGTAFQHFIEQYTYYAENQQSANHSVLLLVFNTDYMTNASSELLYNILHSNIKYLLSFQLEGFIEDNQGVEFLQELTRTHSDENTEYFSEIIKKVSLNPYNLYQTIKCLEETDIISISPEKQGYIISNLDKFRISSNIAFGITGVLEKRLQFICNRIPLERVLLILSIVYVFESIDKYTKNIFQIQSNELDYLCKKNILRLLYHDIYLFDHDIIRDFFYRQFQEHILDCLKWLHAKKCSEIIRKYRTAYILYNIAILNNTKAILDISRQLSNFPISERTASLFYNKLLDAFLGMLESQHYEGIYLKYIQLICARIRQYDGSEKAWYLSKQIYDTIQAYYPNALSEDIMYYRPFIHFCCDIAVQSYFYEQEVLFIKNVLAACEEAHPIGKEEQDELYVLQAIMYNRWYISYNTQSHKEEIKNKRATLMKKSRMYVKKITDVRKKRLIEYLNNSDEGYNFYGYLKDKEQLFNIWNYCITDVPRLVPEKTLNYYRKMVQYGLINQNKTVVREETRKALEYLENGEYSHEPIIFRTFFLMAEVMSNLQHSPEKTYYYNARIIDDILKMQQLLNNHKLGDILLLKGVNAYYAENSDEVYYAYKEAYKYYAAGTTSRYWIKKSLLEENISYTFTILGIYKAGYDVSCFPVKCRQPLVLSLGNEFRASGIQRTGDLHLNLPLI